MGFPLADAPEEEMPVEGGEDELAGLDMEALEDLLEWAKEGQRGKFAPPAEAGGEGLPMEGLDGAADAGGAEPIPGVEAEEEGAAGPSMDKVKAALAAMKRG